MLGNSVLLLLLLLHIAVGQGNNAEPVAGPLGPHRIDVTGGDWAAVADIAAATPRCCCVYPIIMMRTRAAAPLLLMLPLGRGG